MRKIIYKNISPKKIGGLRAEGYSCEEYREASQLANADAFLLGEKEGEVIPDLQEISRNQEDLGIIVLPGNPFLSNHLKAAIQFSPFINKYVNIISTEDIQELKATIAREAELTQTRRRYKDTKEQSINRVLKDQEPENLIKAEFLDKFLTQAPVGAILLNEKDTVLDINDYVKNLIGGKVEFQSRSIYEAFPGHEEQLKLLLSSTSSFSEDVIVTVKDLENLTTYLQLYISHIDTANAHYKMIVVLDVTKEVKAEERSHEYLAQLENHNKELEQFAYIVSHDFKNPITTIKLSCEMAQEAGPEEKVQYMNIIQRSANNLLEMVQGLELMIDIRKSKDLKAPEITFQEILNNILNEYHLEINSDNISITTDFNVAKIYFVRSYLHSIFQNMISNAVKYRKENEALKIHISTEWVGSYLLLKFTDNGIGIDLVKHKENLFQPFRRFTTQASGKGIGLNIVKSMIEKNNGKIEVESTPGVGTTFLCYLCPHD